MIDPYQLYARLRDRKGLAKALIDAALGSAGLRVAGIATAFLVGVQLARYLGPEGYGVYGTVMALVALMHVPANFGLTHLMVRETAGALGAEDPGRARAAIIGFARAVALASAGVVLIGWLGYRLWGGRAETLPAETVGWGLVLIPLVALLNLAAGVLLGLRHVVHGQSYDSLIRPGLHALLLFAAMAALGAVDPPTALMLQVLATAMALAACLIAVVRLTPHAVVAAPRRPLVPGWAASAAAITGTNLMRALEAQYGVLMLGLLAGATEAGLFRVALSAGLALALPAAVVNMAVMPYAARLHGAEDRARLQRLADGAARGCFAATLALTLVVLVFGEALVALIFGADFAPAWPALAVIALGYSVAAFFGAAPAILNMSGGERRVTLAFGAGVALGLALALALMPGLGILGVALGILAGQVVKGALLWHGLLARHGIDSRAVRLRAAAPPQRRG